MTFLPLFVGLIFLDYPAAMVAPLDSAQPFPLSAVQLTGGPFLEAEKRCASYLLEVEPDRLLHSFRKHAGLEPKGAQYGGWENSGLAGHTLGHYLTACAQQYAVSGDSRYKEKADLYRRRIGCLSKRTLRRAHLGHSQWGQIVG